MLSILRLNSNYISIDEVPSLVNMLKRNQVKEIDLSDNQINNNGAQIIADILQTNTVNILCLLFIFYLDFSINYRHYKN